MIDSLEFYLALYILAAPAILTFSFVVLVVLMIPVYLIDTRKDKE